MSNIYNILSLVFKVSNGIALQAGMIQRILSLTGSWLKGEPQFHEDYLSHLVTVLPFVKVCRFS